MRLLRGLTDVLGMTTLVISHDISKVEQFADTSCLLSNGAIVASGRPSELRESKSAAIAQFMNGLADGPVPFHYPAPDINSQMLR